MKFEDILSTLCTKVELRNASDFQKVFVISDAREARLAFDVLTAYGFETKVYPENGESKLYITNPAADDATLPARFAAVAAYAAALRRIKAELDMLCQSAAESLQSPEYSLSFVNLPASGGKQLLVNVLPAAAVANASQAPAQPAAAPAAPSAASAEASLAAAANRPKTSRYIRPKEEENMFSGPSLLADNNKIISKKEKEKQEADTAWRQFTLYVKGNSAVAFSIIVLLLIGLLTMFSMFVVSKGFLCPDLATVKDKTTWYCK